MEYLNLKKKKLKGFLEKPTFNYHVSMGIYVASKGLTKFIPKNKFYGFDNLMKSMIQNKIDINIFESKKSWLDIGRPEDYIKANKIYKLI